MTPEKRYELLTVALRAYCNCDEAPEMADTVLQHPEQWSATTYFPAIAAFAQLIQAARLDMDKKTTPAAVIAAIKRTYANNSGAQEAYIGQFEQGGHWHVMDSYHIIRTRGAEPFPASVPVAPPEERAGRRCDAGKLFEAWEASLHECHEIKVEKLSIKAHMADPNNKGHRGRPGKPYIIHDGAQNIGVNPQYLLDTMTVYPEATIMARRPTDTILLVVDGEVLAAVMPCRVEQPAKEESAA